MKKVVLSFGIAVAVALASCGGSTATNQDAAVDAADEVEVVEIDFIEPDGEEVEEEVVEVAE